MKESLEGFIALYLKMNAAKTCEIDEELVKEAIKKYGESSFQSLKKKVGALKSANTKIKNKNKKLQLDLEGVWIINERLLQILEEATKLIKYQQEGLEKTLK